MTKFVDISNILPMQPQTIGEIIQQRRAKLSIKQEDLAEITGIAPKTIYSIEKNKGNPSLNIIRKILDVLGMEVNIQIKRLDP